MTKPKNNNKKQKTNEKYSKVLLHHDLEQDGVV
jgi:hypothetical protein